MQKGAEAFRSIGEVASLIGVAPHVLRYWETQFTLLRPMKRPDGRRYYRPSDLALAAGICELLRDEGLTIRGARKLIAVDRGEAVRARGLARLATLPDIPASVDVLDDGIAPPAADLVPSAGDDAPASQTPVQIQAPSDVAVPPPALWLARLTEFTRLLERLTPADPRWPAVHPVALRLGQAMLRLS
nr:MerR family transcriptional regulator [Paracoccus saliphilus]